MLAFIASLGMLSTAQPVLPRSVLFHSSPATIAEMMKISGVWENRLRQLSMTLAPLKPGWMKFTIHRGNFNYLPGYPHVYDVAVTSDRGQLFMNIRWRDMVAKVPGFGYDYAGEECYFPEQVIHLANDKIDLRVLDIDSMRLANTWLPAPVPQKADGSFDCGDMVLLAHATEDRHVVVITDPPVPAKEGPFQRVRVGRHRR